MAKRQSGLLEQDLSLKVYKMIPNPKLNLEYSNDLQDIYQLMKIRYGKEIAEFLKSKFEDMISQSCIDFVDNYRVMEIGNNFDEEMFERLKFMGCCGTQEWSVKWKKATGRKFKIGCNHGH